MTQMTIYTVIASNKFYWQRLAICAPSAEEASSAFSAYLAAPQQQAGEEYEYQEQCKIVAGSLDSEDEEAPDRDDYRYEFGEVEEYDYSHELRWAIDNNKIGTAVFCANSGGNG